METGARVWRCCKCDKELVLKKIVFEYLGHTVAHEVPACPTCGKVYIPEDLAEGKMPRSSSNWRTSSVPRR